VSIRKYTELDFEVIENIYLLCKPEEFIYESVNVTIVPLGQDQIRLTEFRESTVFVFELESVVGFITVIDKHIGWLYVDPNYRKQGIGRQLLEFMLKYLSSNTVTLNVTKNNTPALSLYAKYNFVTVKEFDVLVSGVKIEVCQLSYNGVSKIKKSA